MQASYYRGGGMRLRQTQGGGTNVEEVGQGRGFDWKLGC